MTIQELTEQLIAAGGREFPDPINGEKVRMITFRGTDGPECECNERPPQIIVTVWGDYNGHAGNVEFEVVGQQGGEWLKAKIYTVTREKAMGMLPIATEVLKSVWGAYCTEMLKRVPSLQGKT